MSYVLSQAHVAKTRPDLELYRGYGYGKPPQQAWTGIETSEQVDENTQAFEDEIFKLSKQEIYDMYTRMGQRAEDEETVLISELEAEAILDESW